MKDAPRLIKIPNSECPYIYIYNIYISTRRPRRDWPKSLSNIEEPVVPLERNLNGHPPARFCGKDNWKITELGMPICASTARSITLGVRG